MPRSPRMYLADLPCHVIQRGNNRDARFFSDDDYLFYREFFSRQLAQETVHAIRVASDFSMPLGSDRFKKQIESAPGRSIGQAKRVRPSVGAYPKREYVSFVTDPCHGPLSSLGGRFTTVFIQTI